MDTRAAHALVRFGLGRRGAEPLPADPARLALGQLRRSGSQRGWPIRPRRLRASPHCARTGGASPPPGQSRSPRAVPPRRRRATGQCADDRRAVPRAAGLVLDQPLHRLAAPPASAPRCRRLSCEEAIRPHVTGRFDDMLLAVMRHPAMLLYLDNAGSVGPGQPGRPAQRTRPEREPGARVPGTAHGHARRRLHPGRRHLVRPDPDRLVDRAASDPPGFRFRPCTHEPGEHDGDGPALPAGRGRRRRGTAIPRQPSRDAPLPRHQAGAPFRRR